MTLHELEKRGKIQKEKICHLRELAEKGLYEQFMDEFMIVPKLYWELRIDENGEEITNLASYDHKWKMRGFELFEKLCKVEVSTSSELDDGHEYGNHPKGVYLGDGEYISEDEVWY